MTGGAPSDERRVEAGGAEIATQAFGDPGDPPLLLIMGQMASMMWWPTELCERLAAGRRYVLRYDQRDSGESTSYPPGEPGYGPGDLMDDAVAILDAYGIARAHVVGMSMGGMVAQALALREPDRVATLTLISTTPIAGGGELPPPSQAYLEGGAAFEDMDWDDPRQVAEMIVADARGLAGTGRSFDEAAVRAFVVADLARTRNPAALRNHTLLASDGAEDECPDDALARLPAPALVIHGTADPLFPPAHGEALAALVLDGELVLLEGAGHELHRDDWEEIATAIIDRTG